VNNPLFSLYKKGTECKLFSQYPFSRKSSILLELYFKQVDTVHWLQNATVKVNTPIIRRITGRKKSQRWYSTHHISTLSLSLIL
jgi:hypothetical protein